MGRFQRQLLRTVIGIVSRPKRTLLAAAIVLTASIAFAMMRLNISTDQNKLFDPNVSFFRDYLHFIKAFPENEAVYVVVRASNRDALPPIKRWTQIADEIAGKLGQMSDVVRAVDARVPIDKLGAQGLVFDAPDLVRKEFDGIKQFSPLIKVIVEKDTLRSAILGATPTERLISALDRAPAGSGTEPLVSLLADSWNDTIAHNEPLRIGAGLPDMASLEATDPSRLGYYFVPDQVDPTQHLLLVRVYPKSDFDSLTAISQTVEAITAGVGDVAKGFPEFTVGLTGRPALESDEMRSTDRDSHKAEALALIAVFIGLVVALRSFWLALAGEIALGVGIGWTFGWATLSVGELNLLSIVFLLALIGIGMDYLVQILTRYRLEAARRHDPRRIWIAVFRHVAAPINTACLGAAGAFAVSILTKFRGAAQLGVIAGGGLLLCLLAGYIVLPALLTLLPVRRPSNVQTSPATIEASRSMRGRGWLLLPVIWCALLAVGMPYALRTKFNPDLLSLQSPDHESVKLVRHLQTWSAVVLSNDINQLRQVRAALATSSLIASTDSLLNAADNLDFLRAHTNELPTIAWPDEKPIDRATIPSLARKSRSLSDKIAKSNTHASAALTEFAQTLSDADGDERDRIVARLNEWQSGFIRQLRDAVAPFELKTLDIDALPAELRTHFVGANGEFALYVYPKADLWEQVNLVAFARDVETRVSTVAGAPAPTGIAIELYHSTASIENSFYHATGYALGLIVVLVFLDLRRFGMTALAISVLAFGLPLLVILMGVMKVDWNFANFFALPILIGAGHEYGVFMVHRYIEARDYPLRRWGRWDVSDRALMLCAYVTCTSFGFFWALASHRGLRSLGLVMTLGTACIYLASLLVLRPVLRWKLSRRSPT